MTRRAPLLLAALLSLLTSSLLAVPAAGAREVGFTTIAWGRSNWRAMDDCRAVPDTRTLEQDAQDLDARGLFGVGGVVAGRTEETTRPCINKQDPAAQAAVEADFAFGRTYGHGMNTRASVSVWPHPLLVLSVNGGGCFNPDLPCYVPQVVGASPPTSVPKIAAALSPGAGEWGVVQFYRWVTGKRGRLGDFLAWDCTSPDWRDRWTSQVELSCRNSALEAIDRRGPSVVTHPAAVAAAWGVR
jgi:hypothetical protein